MSKKKQGLQPLVVGSPKILVLGTLPGNKSLEMKEYYSNPSNRFWKIVAALLDRDSVPNDYEGRKKILECAHIALWDVYKNAIRKDSLDNHIKNAKVNNLDRILNLLQKNFDIETIVFNGKRASKVFSEKLQNELKAKLEGRRIEFCPLSSTSGANSKKTNNDLIKEWKGKLGSL